MTRRSDNRLSTGREPDAQKGSGSAVEVPTTAADRSSSYLDGTKADAGYSQNTSGAGAQLTTTDSLTFAIQALQRRALTIVALRAKVKRLEATIARLRNTKKENPK